MESSAVFCKTYEPHADSEFWRYPSHKVLGVFNNPDSVSNAVAALREFGMDDTSIVVFCGQQGEKQIDFSGKRHGLWASLVRSLLALSAEHSYLEYYQKELHAGHYLVGAVVSDSDHKKKVAGLMHTNGGKRIAYFGAWIIEEMANKPRHVESSYGVSRVVDFPFDTAVQRTKDALVEQGFGVLTEIDLKAKFKEKLDKDFPNYLILGACNPAFAFEGLQKDIDLGLLLPCNVVVYENSGKTIVSAIEARKMLSITHNAALHEVASEVDKRLRKAIDSV